MERENEFIDVNKSITRRVYRDHGRVYCGEKLGADGVLVRGCNTQCVNIIYEIRR